MRPITALFITNDASNYGASRSLQLLLRNYRDAVIDMVVAKRLTGDVSEETVRERFGGRVRNVWKCHLPIDYCYKGKPDSHVMLRTYMALLRFLWRLDRTTLTSIIERGGYDFVHLNTLVLHGIIVPRFPFLLHAREIYDGSSPAVADSLRNARGVVFISREAQEPFRGMALPPHIVLNNPVDMRPSGSGYTEAELAGKGIDPRTQVLFAMVGKITPDKGVDFIIRTFMRLSDDRARLLIVGRSPGDPLSRLRSRMLAAKDRRIVFWGEEPEIAKVYQITDHLLRGEPYQCVGRTIYEGLYAGCSVIIPGSPDARGSLFEYDTYGPKISFYPPRDGDALLALLRDLAQRKVTSRTMRSNIDQYVQDFHRFALSVIDDRG